MPRIMKSGVVRTMVAAALLVFACSPALAQKKKKDTKKADTTPIVPAEMQNDNDQIDKALGEMLAGWQIGDTSLMQKHYAPDAVFVSGAYEPPVLGWSNYAQLYQTQKQRMSNIAMDRFNTLIRVKGNSAISNYQWQFSATVDGVAMWARGQSTLVWEKKDGKWLATHNHTSLIDQGTPQAAKPAAPAPKQP